MLSQVDLILSSCLGLLHCRWGEGDRMGWGETDKAQHCHGLPSFLLSGQVQVQLSGAGTQTQRGAEEQGLSSLEKAPNSFPAIIQIL